MQIIFLPWSRNLHLIQNKTEKCFKFRANAFGYLNQMNFEFQPMEKILS